MDISGKCESALDAPSGSQGCSDNHACCSGTRTWGAGGFLLTLYSLEDGLGPACLPKVGQSESLRGTCVGGRPGGPLSPGLLRKVPFVSSPGWQGWKVPSPGVLPEAAWLRTRCCPACLVAGTTRWDTHGQAQGIPSPSPGRGGSGGNAIPSSLASLENEFSSTPLSPPRMGQQGFPSALD